MIFFPAPIIWSIEKKIVNAMTDQNSVVVPQIRPEQAMEQLNIRKDAYYADLKYLGIQAQKDSEGKRYLDQRQFQLLMALRKHVEETGKRQGFQMSGELAPVASGSMAGVEAEQLYPEGMPQPEQFDLPGLIAEANVLAVNRMTMREQLVNALANQMSFDDLMPESQARVLNLRETVKKPQPQKMAEAMLSQWRQQRQAQPEQPSVSAP